jgi:phosphoglycolate phosphatase-like HAD superfamily hydrolase
MRIGSSRWLLGALLVAALGIARAQPLESWNDGAPKQAIIAFVERVTRAGGADFVPPAERIAVFDNDGTLWVEQPMYTQLAFALDRVQAMAPQHPDWRDLQPFKGILDGDLRALLASGERGIGEVIAATHAGMSTDEFSRAVLAWTRSAVHPTLRRPYLELVYQPMLEVLDYLRGNGFKTFIVSGGGAEFMRPWTERVYGIPPEQVVGSRGKLRYEVTNGTPRLAKLAEIDLVDDGPGKPAGIQQQIGRRPVMAFGNSDGDFEMLEWTTSGHGARFAMLVHHTDGKREWAYDRGSPLGKLERGLDEAATRGWVVADMARDWKVIFPFERDVVAD